MIRRRSPLRKGWEYVNSIFCDGLILLCDGSFPTGIDTSPAHAFDVDADPRMKPQWHIACHDFARNAYASAHSPSQGGSISADA